MALKTVRFALGSLEHPSSGVWHLRVQEDDVHLEVHATREVVELTAYRTGRWRISAGGSVSRWTRPKEFRPGWIRGPDLVIPATGPGLVLPSAATEAPGPAITWLPGPPTGQRARFSLLFASPRSAEHRWQPTDAPATTSVAILALRSAGALHLCRTDEIDPDANPSADSSTRPGALAIVVSADRSGLPSLTEVHER